MDNFVVIPESGIICNVLLFAMFQIRLHPFCVQTDVGILGAFRDAGCHASKVFKFDFVHMGLSKPLYRSSLVGNGIRIWRNVSLQ